MSDLRTRIAAVLSDALVADNSILTVQYGSGSTSNIVVNCNALADAVIRELQLTVDGGVIVGCIHA